MEQFEDVLERHVELSFFVPLIMGHGGNTGSQAVTTVIRCARRRPMGPWRRALRGWTVLAFLVLGRAAVCLACDGMMQAPSAKTPGDEPVSQTIMHNEQGAGPEADHQPRRGARGAQGGRGRLHDG